MIAREIKLVFEINAGTRAPVFAVKTLFVPYSIIYQSALVNRVLQATRSFCANLFKVIILREFNESVMRKFC